LGSEKVIKSFETSSPLSSIKKEWVDFGFNCKARSIPADLFLM
jgi:hypothetical protein